MSKFSYQRVDLSRVQAEDAANNTSSQSDSHLGFSRTIRWSIFPVVLVLCVIQSYITITGDNLRGDMITSTLIGILAFVLLFFLVLVANPLLYLARKVLGKWFFRPFNRAELFCVFAPLLITSGISTFGLAAHLVPLITAPYNEDWNNDQRGWNEHLTKPHDPALNDHLYITDVNVIRTYREGIPTPDLVQPEAGAGFWTEMKFDFDRYMAVGSKIDWEAWLSPIGYWLFFVFGCYGLFYCLTYVVLGYWSDREKLLFPLSQLPMNLMPEQGSGRLLPPIFRSPMFWSGLFFALLVMSWNGLVGWEVINPEFRIQLGMSPWKFSAITRGTFLHGLSGISEHDTPFLIIFTAIGIAFLLPTQITFSTWFYFLIGKLMILMAVWMGFGENTVDFPSNYLTINSFVTAQGAGAMLLFSLISLFRSVREYVYLTLGKSWKEKFRVAMPVVGLVIFQVLLTLWVVWNGISILLALAFVFFITLITLGLMRIVAEAGIYWFQAHAGFFHVAKTFGLSGMTNPVSVGVLMPIYMVLFVDIKTFIAPNILTSAKMEKDVKAGRFRYHTMLITCMVITVIFSILMTVLLAHVIGGQVMSGWFFTVMPEFTLNSAVDMIDSTEMDGWMVFWYIIGAAWVGISMFIRQTVFWFPHPIGYILLFNSLLRFIWFSFFIGWIFKAVVVKYGGKSTYDRIRPIFIGLIIGELLALVIWAFLGAAFDFYSGLTLNRMEP